MRLKSICAILALPALLAIALPAFAAGHGPVFGLATPTNSQAEWSFDFGVVGRNTPLDTEVEARSMLTYGFTPHLQWSLVVPGFLNTIAAPPTRNMGGDLESNVGWRFLHNAKAVGTRLESTAYLGMVVPGMQRMPGMLGMLHRAPGVNSALATGLASRSHYLWGGAQYTRFATREGDRRPAVFDYSLVYGYRPRALRKEYEFWDWRVFAEMTGEVWDHAEKSGLVMPGTSGQQLFLGPTTLGIYKSFAIEGGVQFPIFRDVSPVYPRERLRFAINISYFLFSRNHTH